MSRKYWFVLPSLLYLALCTVLLTLPGSAFPEEHWFDVIYLDKWIHTGMFGGMVTVIGWTAWKIKGRGNISLNDLVKIGIACLAYGIAMEFVQRYWVINRSFDVTDIAADAVGSALGVLFSWRVYIKK